jgi:hypothetical protein
VKERAVEAELEDDSRFDFEGLFELGSKDAYSQRAYVPERLHDYIERTRDECWQLHVMRVVNSQQNNLAGVSVLCSTLSSHQQHLWTRSKMLDTLKIFEPLDNIRGFCCCLAQS